MRIIAGQRRGHKFDGPRDHATRPTSDLVRESLFNILGEAVAGRVVIDLFAGTGGIGLEALSRGAAQAIFVERHRANVELIRRNVATLRFEDRAAVIGHDAYRWAKTFVPDGPEPVAVFIDPPYADYDDHPERVRRLLEGLLTNLPRGSIIAAESSRKLDDDVLPNLATWDIRRYGGTQVAIRLVGEDRLDHDSDGPAVDGEPADAASSDPASGDPEEAVDGSS